jgi:hypothetical protein
MNEDKLKFYLEKIEKLYPNKSKLNLGEMLNCINKSRATFKRILEANELYKIPDISKKESYKREGSNYHTYQFDVYEVAKFLVEN